MAAKNNNEISLDEILDDLNFVKRMYDLGGVEITREDAHRVRILLNSGYTKIEAMKEVLTGIYDCLHEDDEEGTEYEDGINTKKDIYRWLKDKIAEYGNTYHFPYSDKTYHFPYSDKIMLDKLVDRFGSTYFWRG